MIQKIKTFALAAMTLLTMSVPMLAPAVVSAQCSSDVGDSVAKGASGALTGTQSTLLCTPGNSASQDGITTIAKTIVNILSIVVGAIAVIMIIYGGLRYITSGGDSGNVGNAKNTLVYAIIGLVIVALAQLIVHFVLGQTSNITQ